MKYSVWLSAIVLMAVACSAGAAQSASEIIEKARAQAKEVEQLKKVMASPDRNLRLAAFQAMRQSDNPLFRSYAIEAGLSSTDSLLKAAALKAAIFNLNGMVIDLKADPEAPDKIREISKKWLDEHAPSLVLQFSDKAPEKNTLTVHWDENNGYRGPAEVQGINYVFNMGYPDHIQIRAKMTPVDAASIQGPITYNTMRFIGTADLR